MTVEIVRFNLKHLHRLSAYIMAIEHKMKGPNWERAQDVSKLAAIPHILYKNQWEHKKELVSVYACALLLFLGMVIEDQSE